MTYKDSAWQIRGSKGLTHGFPGSRTRDTATNTTGQGVAGDEDYEYGYDAHCYRQEVGQVRVYLPFHTAPPETSPLIVVPKMDQDISMLKVYTIRPTNKDQAAVWRIITVSPGPFSTPTWRMERM